MHQTDHLDNGLFPTKDQLGRHNERELAQKALNWGKIGLWVWDIAANELHLASSGLSEHFGYADDTLATLSVDDWVKRIHPEDEMISEQVFNAILEGREDAYETKYRVQTVSGEYVTLYVLGRVTARDSEGKPLQLGGVARDVSLIAQAEADTQHRDHLLTVANESARLLLRASLEDFDMTVWRVLHLLGSAAQADRVHVWKDYIGSDGRPHATLMYEWLGGDGPPHSRWASNIAYDKSFPTWYKELAEGLCINHTVHLKPQSSQENLSPRGIVSILVAPIQYNGKPWGFIGLGDCHGERTWNEAEKGVLKSIGILIATAINRHEIITALETERAMLNQIFETSPISLTITTNGVVQRCNRHCTETFGVDVGQSVQSSYRLPTFRNEILEEVCRKGYVTDRNVQLRGEGGMVRDVLATYQPIIYEGKPSILCWAVDISDLKKTEKSLTTAKDLAEKATRVKSEFLSNVSHELRTPMNAVIGMIHLCCQTELTDQQKNYLNTALTASNDLLEIIENILDFSKIEAQQFEIGEVLFSLKEILDEVLGTIGRKAKEKNLFLKLEIDKGICDSLLGSPFCLKGVLNNLLDNAIKFTERDGVTLTVHQDKPEKPTSQVRLQFTIQDTGIGMTTNQMSKLFEPFSQADNSTTRKYGGAGLGLPLSKRLVELMGGNIDISSTPEQGTTVRFTVVFRK